MRSDGAHIKGEKAGITLHVINEPEVKGRMGHGAATQASSSSWGGWALGGRMEVHPRVQFATDLVPQLLAVEAGRLLGALGHHVVLRPAAVARTATR